MTWRRVCALARALPEVVEEPWYGTPALKVRGKGIARLKEDGKTIMFRLQSVDEQEFLVASQPGIFFITEHYRGHAAVLARLALLRVPECRLRLELAWRAQAPRILRAQAEEPRRPRRITKEY